ncbi:ABC transporter permease [Ulvibacterium marinum]|uniref:DUF3526 domain-containing protein n=1 Tax=Ulvibacterium marinum TaxID=2419782 RepID=A0A3B0BUA5_9FLAO|nr:DUF3526 domain-containing protein [Ulvibacterium marinum]RKN76983.1 DUF3526 domain-containing protein [Ulvibacterium marinum]
MRKLILIARKEIKIALREKLIVSLGLLISLLLMVALYAGYLAYKQQKEAIIQTRAEKRQQWLEQGDKHPHIAAHYGTFAFKPKTIFSLFDFGLDTFTGTSVYLEAHHQHEFMFRPAQDHSSMIRFGELSAAMVLQVLLPLLIIFLAFASFTRERESGTLRLLISQGVSYRTLIWGKVLAYTIMITALLLPFLLGTSLLATSGVRSETISDVTVRALLLFLLYGIYLFLFISFSVWVSFRSSTGKNALLTLLTVWIFFTMLMPKTVANMSENFYKSPSMRVFKAQIQDDIANGMDGNTPRSARMAKLEKEYLDKYDIDSVQQLPFNFEGVSMQAGEEFSNSVYDHHLGNLRNIFSKQDRLASLSSLLNPYLIVQHLSMGLAGTDIHTSLHFEDEVEQYRRGLVKEMNNDMAQNSRYGEFYEYKAGSDLWRRIKDFSYRSPKALDILKNYKTELTSLLIWLTLVLILLSFPDRKTTRLL